MITEKLGIDKRDVEIINLYMENPSYSQADIAGKLKLSQPSINARINKLKAKGILNFDTGINFNNANLVMGRADFHAKNPQEILDIIKNCTFFVNAFTTSGEQNVSVFLVGEDLEKIEEIITNHLRNNSDISNISLTLITSAVKEFLFKLDLTKEITSKHCFKKNGCKACQNIKANKPQYI